MSGEVAVSAGTVISVLATALCGVCVFFVKKYLDKVERLDAEAVRKRELKELEERLAQDQREMHEQNRSTLGEIKSDIGRMTARIDAMFNRGSRQ